MKKINFHSTFAVAMQGDFQFNINWIGTLKSSNNKVDVIIFNTESKNDFLPLIEADLSSLAQADQNNPNVQDQISYLGHLKEEVKQKVFHKTPDNDLIKAVENSLNQRLAKEQYLYLSGVSAIVE